MILEPPRTQPQCCWIRNNINMNYPEPTTRRASLALACSPFKLHLFQVMQHQSVALQEIADRSGLAYAYTTQPLSERNVERALLWLIQVGLLRREVDGQGLTDSFRLTPLGRQIVDHYQSSGRADARPALIERCQDTCSRWFQFANQFAN